MGLALSQKPKSRFEASILHRWLVFFRLSLPSRSFAASAPLCNHLLTNCKSSNPQEGPPWLLKFSGWISFHSAGSACCAWPILGFAKVSPTILSRCKPWAGQRIKESANVCQNLQETPSQTSLSSFRSFFKIGLLDHIRKGRRPEMEDGFVFVDQVCGGRGSNSD